MKIVLIRHSVTEGTKIRNYTGGRTDEPLCSEGIALAAPKADLSVAEIYSSPMIRCIQTAKIMFPNADVTVIENFREIYFGDFEGKGFAELSGNAQYKAWVNSFCEQPPPNGEGLADFNLRVRPAFDEICSKGKDAVIMCHGGTIMSIMSYLFPGRPYYEYRADFCKGFVVDTMNKIYAEYD